MILGGVNSFIHIGVIELFAHCDEGLLCPVLLATINRLEGAMDVVACSRCRRTDRFCDTDV